VPIWCPRPGTGQQWHSVVNTRQRGRDCSHRAGWGRTLRHRAGCDRRSLSAGHPGLAVRGRHPYGCARARPAFRRASCRPGSVPPHIGDRDNRQRDPEHRAEDKALSGPWGRPAG
jgi:hypothetical protein